MSCYEDYPICTICGIITIRPRDDYDLEDDPSLQYCAMWRGSTIALSGPFWNYKDCISDIMTNVLEEQVRFQAAETDEDQADLIIMPDGPTITPQTRYDAIAFENLDLELRRHFVLGIHSACLEMARRVMETSRIASIRTIRDLWVTLERRCTRTSRDLRLWSSFVPFIPENRRGEPIKLNLKRYYVPVRHIGGEPDEEQHDWWYYDPLQIPEMTASLVSNLTQYFPQDSDSGFRTRFKRLPQELKDRIVEFIPGQPLSLPCSHLIPQYYWRRVFDQIPFLWDIDRDIICNKVSKAEAAGFAWDWEKLTRRLMAPVQMCEDSETELDAWSYEQVGLDLPPGLSNRRRIWQILEEMYPNDAGLK